MRRITRRGIVRILIGAPFAFWLWTKLFWPSTILDGPEIAANLYAKETCSCLFVVGQSEEICRENTKQWFPASKIVIDRAKGDVNARSFWAISQAHFFGPDEGCRIVRM